MCKGTTTKQQARKPDPGPKRHETSHDSGSGSICELCGSEATLYCQADDAYLCGQCDGWVHGANFLASRHVRCLLCDTCHRFSHRFVVGKSRQLELAEAVVGGKRSRRSHCDGRKDCSSLRILKRPFVFI